MRLASRSRQIEFSLIVLQSGFDATLPLSVRKATESRRTPKRFARRRTVILRSTASIMFGRLLTARCVCATPPPRTALQPSVATIARNTSWGWRSVLMAASNEEPLSSNATTPPTKETTAASKRAAGTSKSTTRSANRATAASNATTVSTNRTTAASNSAGRESNAFDESPKPFDDLALFLVLPLCRLMPSIQRFRMHCALCCRRSCVWWRRSAVWCTRCAV